MSGSGNGAEKKKRSPLERIIVQGGIVVLLVIVAIEFRAQKGYTDTLEKIRVASEDGEKELTLDEVVGLLTLAPSSSVVAENATATTTCYSWFSVFKSGQFKINVVGSKADPKVMRRYYTGSDGDPMAAQRPTEFTTAPTPEQRKEMMQGSGGSGPPSGESKGKSGDERPSPEDSTKDTPPATSTDSEPKSE